MILTLSLVTFVVTYVLIATERVHRVAAVLGGVAVMMVLGVVEAETAFFSQDTGIDWNVIFLLLGMMVIVSIFKQTGVFDFLAIWAAKRSEGRPYRLMVMLLLIVAVLSPILDNVTIMLLVAPVTFMICRRLGVAAAPYLIAEILASNIGGAATLIGDPPNIIIGSRANLSFDDFLNHMTPIVVVLLVVLTLMCRVMFRKDFEYHPERVAEIMRLDPRASLRNIPMLLRCLAVLVLVIVGFTLHSTLDIEPSVVALLGAGAMVLESRTSPKEFLEEVEWPTLVFFMGLFVLVGALVELGVIEWLGEHAIHALGDNYLLAATALLFGSPVLGAVVDNIPYAATMAPLVEQLAEGATNPAHGEALWWAFAMGADFGGNTTAVAASANVVVLGIAASQGEPISFWKFTKYGILVTAVTVTLCWPYVWLRYFAFT